MQNSEEITIQNIVKIVIKRKLLITCLVCFASIASAIYLYTHPRMYKAVIKPEISPLKIYYFDSFGENMRTFTISSLQPAQTLPTHIKLLKSQVILERIIQNLENMNIHFTPTELRKKLTVKVISKGGEFIIETQDSNPEIALRLVNIWAQEYQAYTEEITKFLVESFILSSNESQIIVLDKQRDDLMRRQELNEQSLKNLNVNNINQPSLASIITELNNIRAGITSNQKLRKQLIEKIDKQKKDLARAQKELNMPRSWIKSLMDVSAAVKKNDAHKNILIVNNEMLLGHFSFSSLAKKANLSGLTNKWALISMTLTAFFFAIFLALLIEPHHTNIPKAN